MTDIKVSARQEIDNFKRTKQTGAPRNRIGRVFHPALRRFFQGGMYALPVLGAMTGPVGLGVGLAVSGLCYKMQKNEKCFTENLQNITVRNAESFARMMRERQVNPTVQAEALKKYILEESPLRSGKNYLKQHPTAIDTIMQGKKAPLVASSPLTFLSPMLDKMLRREKMPRTILGGLKNMFNPKYYALEKQAKKMAQEAYQKTQIESVPMPIVPKRSAELPRKISNHRLLENHSYRPIMTYTPQRETTQNRTSPALSQAMLLAFKNGKMQKKSVKKLTK